MKTRGQENTSPKQYNPEAHMDALRSREERIEKIKSEMPRGTKTYMRNRLRDHKRTLKHA